MAINADGSGKVVGRFTIPPQVPAGTKLVEFQGRGGSKAAATFVGRGVISTTELRRIRTEALITTETWQRYDPLAQTFTLDQPRMISGVDLWFCAKGASGRTLVQIRETAVGIPTQQALVTVVLPTVSLLTGQWQRVSWPPIRLEAGVEYAIVVGCDDAVTQAGVAVLGQFDSAAQKFAYQQPYQIGVLLSSSNGSTWTPHQDRDLSFRLLETPFATNTRTVPLPSFNVTNADELMVLAAVDLPTSDCSVTFRLTLPDNSTISVAAGERVLLPQTISGTIQLAALLVGNRAASPRVDRNVQVVWGTRGTSGTYITLSLPAGGASSPSTVAVYFEALTPGTSSFLVEIARDAAGTGGWQTVPVVAGTPVGDGWVQTKCQIAGWLPTSAVIRITAAGDARNRPLLRTRTQGGGVRVVVLK